MNTEIEALKAKIAELEAKLDAMETPDPEAERWAKEYYGYLQANYSTWEMPDISKDITSAMRYVIDGLRAEWEANAGPRRLPDGLPTAEELVRVYNAGWGTTAGVFESERAALSAVLDHITPFLHEPTSVTMDVTEDEMRDIFCQCNRDHVDPYPKIVAFCNSRLRAKYGRRLPDGVTVEVLAQWNKPLCPPFGDLLRKLIAECDS